ncbi:MAG: DUF4384 domain-containing protein, partial [Acidobacteria bacterium]|nr:DUF4384 domain-containing protein [Acidobacteriota bacterium]
MGESISFIANIALSQKVNAKPQERKKGPQGAEVRHWTKQAGGSLLAVCLVSACLAQAPADQNVRGIFLESRPAKETKAAQAAPKAGKGPAQAGRLALGYTLFLDAAEGPRRVKPERVFHSGDRLRLLVELNRDGFLYVLHQEEDGTSTLLYPDARIEDGENRVAAHGLCEVPAGAWFVFDEQPGDERLTLVASEKPLENIPRGKQLAGRPGFKLTPAEVARLMAGAQKAESSSAADEGRPMSKAEGHRGLTLSAADPGPSRVLMKTSAQAGW